MVHDPHGRVGSRDPAFVGCAGINGVAVGAPVMPAGVVFEASQAAAAAAAGSQEAADSAVDAAGAARRRSPDTGLPGAFCARG